jgi:hypothetical protein
MSTRSRPTTEGEGPREDAHPAPDFFRKRVYGGVVGRGLDESEAGAHYEGPRGDQHGRGSGEGRNEQDRESHDPEPREDGEPHADAVGEPPCHRRGWPERYDLAASNRRATSSQAIALQFLGDRLWSLCSFWVLSPGDHLPVDSDAARRLARACARS